MLQNSSFYPLYIRFNQFIGYTFFGLIATLVHFICLYSLVDIFHLLTPVKASVVAFLCGATVGFMCNRIFVFKRSNAGFAALSKYLLLTGFSIINNTILMYIFIDIFIWNYLISQVCATLTIFIINYIVCKFLIFKEPANAQ